MPRADRLQVIKRLQEQRGSVAICYLTSTRQGMEAPMAMDVIRLSYEHLKAVSVLPTVNQRKI